MLAAASAVAFQSRRLETWHRIATQRTLGAALGINIYNAEMTPAIAEFMARWRTTNINLIRSLPEVVKRGLDRRVATIAVGDRGALADILAKEYRVSGYRLRLITRDQTTKYVSGMNRIRQTNAGVQGYIWTATRDERVRPDHWALNGQRFLWSAPPSIGHPGDPINCRCVARPDVRSLTPGSPSANL